MAKNASLPQKKLNDKYILGDEIGKGAYGRVYKGLDMDNGDFVAIKQVSLENIPQEDLNIIMQEIDLLKNLNHKNIVKYMGSFKTKTHLYIILEYVENGSLASIVKPNKFGAFPESLVAVYITQVLDGLVYLHEQGVIHRDIKGANILTTKEGLVKLADFGVATKLTEADINTHSVVGTPYWMAPEVIEMSGVSAASDIWSVGCTVIELLTCEPPYFDLQPMPALFRIVQDEHPPIPEHLSSGITDFLHQCFRKDAKLRPDAKTLLMHPWIQTSRRDLQSSLSGGHIRNIPQHVSTVVERTIEDGIKERNEDMSDKDTPSESVNENELENIASGGSLQLSTSQVRSVRRKDRKKNLDDDNAVKPKENGKAKEIMLSERVSIKDDSHGSESVNGTTKSNHEVNESGQKLHKGYKYSSPSSAHALSRFSDTAADETLDDLFEEPFQDTKNSSILETSLSSPISEASLPSSNMVEADKSDLAGKLKAKMLQKQTDSKSKNKTGSNLFSVMMDVVKDDGTGIDGIAIEEKVSSKDIFPIQAVEVSRLFSMLKPEESEDVIVSTCQKLVGIFQDFAEQKTAFTNQHGLVPLMDMLEVANNRVVISVLQIINILISENVKCQENACLIGLIPVVMNLASPDHSKEIRMEAAYFVQQLCQTSKSTLQMFIACRGLPVLVGFLEPDYSKYREMVHIAVDCMWNVFTLETCTPQNDFCRISAKNGILIRLVNTLHSLNEAARLACMVSRGAVITGPENAIQRQEIISSLSENNDSQIRTGNLEISRSRQCSNDLQSMVGGPSESTSEPEFRSSNRQPGKGSSSSYLFTPSTGTNTSDSSESILSSRGQGSNIPLSRDREQLNSGQEISHLEEHHGKQHGVQSTPRGILDQSHKQANLSHFANGVNTQPLTSQQEPVQPLLSLLEKEPPSRHVSGQLEYIRHLSGGFERHESILPLLHHTAVDRKNSELDVLMSAIADVSATDLSSKQSPRSNIRNGTSLPSSTVPSREAGASTSENALQTASGVLSGSGILNIRPGSTTSSGILSQMVPSLNADVAKEYLKKVADLLLEFSRADTTVKSYMCSVSLLIRLFQMLSKLDSGILLKILKCINQLSMDPNCLEPLQRADAIKHLIPNLEDRDGLLVPEIHYEALNALYNLCKINKRRQEQAAENGIIPHLMRFIVNNSPLKTTALPLLCDMAHASRYTREQLKVFNGLDVYLSLLDDEIWSVTALDSIAVCLAHDNDHRKVEQILLKKESVQKLVTFFKCCNERYFVHILEPFLKIVTKSVRINTTLAVNGLTPLLVARLDHQDAIARLNLLKLIKAVYEHHPRPKELIVENDLPLKLQNLIEERGRQRSGGQVLVKQMATALLKALHINTIL